MRLKSLFRITEIKRYFFNLLFGLPIDYFLYSLVLLIFLSVMSSVATRVTMQKNLDQQRMEKDVVFELDYAHDWIVRSVDVTMRGFAIIQDERYLYHTNKFLRVELEMNFKRLDSLLKLQGYNDAQGKRAIETYKSTMRSFVIYHNHMLQLLKAGKREEFLSEFSKDIGSGLWPVYSNAIGAVSKFESKLTKRTNERYHFFSRGMVYIQTFALLLSIPIVLLVLKRLRNEKRTTLLLEERKLIDETNRVKENMLSMMSHEIRTPLNSLIGLTHVLIRRNPRPDQIEIINTMKNSSDHLIHLVNDILDFNKIQANKVELEMCPFELNAVLLQIHDLHFQMANEKNLSFNVKIDSTTPLQLIGDSTRLLQILNNLVVNAIKFTASGFVHVAVHPVKQEEGSVIVNFVIKDSGIGIAEDKKATLFYPFAQADKHIHKKYGGTGLGLLIVKNLTEMMGGTLEVQSIIEEGSLFSVTIPFQIQQTAELEDPSGKQRINYLSLLKDKRILYVEDVESNRFLVNSLLDDYHIICENASDGSEAMIAIQNNTFDVILLDVQMPDMDGYRVAKLIRTDSLSKNHRTPIILFSAYTNINEREVTACGANDFIGKPFQPDELIEKIRRFVTVAPAS